MFQLDILDAPRNVKRVLLLVADICILPFAVFVSIALDSNFHLDQLPTVQELGAISLHACVSAWVFMKLGLYKAVVRYMGQEAMVVLIKGVTISMGVLVASYMLAGISYQASFPLIYWVVGFCFVGGTRFFVREIVHARMKSKKKNVLIYGAGNTGMQLLMSLHNGDKYEPRALIDDNRELIGVEFQGVKVFSPDSIEEKVKQFDVDQILLAMPSIPSWRKKEILASIEYLPVRIKTVPSVEQLVLGEAKIEQVRDVEVEDLLGREPVAPNTDLLKANILGKNVLVTGAGGSIGSELCRQILRSRPQRLLLFERCEFALYAIEKELREVIASEGLDTVLIALLGCVKDEERVYSVFDAFDVDTVYHAAAYKHVPMVEQNVIEGVRNNVFGTYVCAKAAADAEVNTFVLISTDKAVRPTNIMGASKRMAELVLQGLAKKRNKTRFSMVRFGNVLGSSGSVVPLFKKQIREGGPITVTHPEIIRYFMTIPEAAQLVIQAGAMTKGGDVFVLDMGEPVKIAELARTMVRLMGLEVKEAEDQEGDIEIKYTGLRPGEKLFEELLIGENAHGTAHPRILKAHEISLPWDRLSVVLDELAAACDSKDCEAIRELLLNSETGYVPTDKVCDLVWQHSNASVKNVLTMKYKTDLKERAV